MSSNELSNITSQCVDYGQKYSNNLAAYCVLLSTYPGYTSHKQWGKIILEITLNPKIRQYDVKNKIYPKGRSTLGMPGTRVTKKRDKKWKHGR